MKLATLKDGSRDGQLAVVARDLSRAHFAAAIAGTLQRALDDWNFLSPQLEDLYATLNDGTARHAFAFDPRLCMAPLPRAFQWLEGPAHPAHLERVLHARCAEGSAGLLATPTMVQGASDDLLGPCDDLACAGDGASVDFGAGLAVVTGDVAQGIAAASALDSVRLLLLVNAWALLDPAAPAGGPGAHGGRLATALGPVAVTPDELGEAWQGGRVLLALESRRNGHRVGHVDAAAEMAFHFGELIASAAATRRLRAGSIVGGGTVARRAPDGGMHSIAELRAIEAETTGAARSDWLRSGDSVRVEMLGRNGLSLFGAIEQRITAAAS